MAKVNGYGKAKVFNEADKNKLVNKGLLTHAHRTLFLLTYYTGCRVSEAVQLRTEDTYQILSEWYEHDELTTRKKKAVIFDQITFRKETTKGKTSTRTIPIHDELRSYLERHAPGHEYVFRGRTAETEDGQKITGHLTARGADHVIRRGCERAGLRGYSTHSGRRTLVTRLHQAGVGLKTIQDITGHSQLKSLQEYVEVSDSQKASAINLL